MALIVCVECGKAFSNKARQCPECGCPIQFSLTNSNINIMPIQYDSRNDIVQQPHVRYDLIEKILSQIRMMRSKPQNKERQVQIFHIDDWAFSYTDADRLFLFLYKTFHDETDKLIKKYKDNFLLEVKAVNMYEIKALEAVLNKCEVSETQMLISQILDKGNVSRDEIDPRPFANRFMTKIDLYREEKESDYNIVTDIDWEMEEAIKDAGKKILKTLENDYSVAPSVEPHIRIIIFYFQEIYKNYFESKDDFEYDKDETLEAYINLFYSGEELYSNFLYQIQNQSFSEYFKEYTDFFSNSHDDIVKRAKDEIKWRKKYLEAPNKYKLWEKLAEDVDRIILFMIQNMEEKCRFGIPPVYYNWNTYRSTKIKLSSLNSIQDEHEKKSVFKECFLNFPFNSDAYPYLLDMYGDQDGEMSKLLTQLNVNVEALKKALLERYVEAVYTKVNWKNVDTIMEVYKNINSKKEFLVYEGDTSDKYNKIHTEYNEYRAWEKLLEEKSILGIQDICDLLETKAGFPNDSGSEKLKKGLNIGNDIVIYFAHDDTAFKNGKNGFAITNKGFFVREIFKKPVFYSNDDLISDNHTYKIGSGNVVVDDKILFYYTGNKEISNKLYIAAKYIIPLMTPCDKTKEEDQKKFCVFCGKRISVSSKFCQFCGEESTYGMS